MADAAPVEPEKLVSFVDAVLFHASRSPHSPAIGLESGVLTYAQLADAIYAATAACENAGLRPGSLAALMIADPVWHLCLIAALYRLGVASVSLAPDELAVFTSGDLAAVLHDGTPPSTFLPGASFWSIPRGSRTGRLQCASATMHFARMTSAAWRCRRAPPVCRSRSRWIR